MNDIITLRGIVGTDPRQITTATGLDITSFRLASTQRRYNREKNEWVDGDTNWYGISTYRQLARNTSASIKKGDPVIITGRVRVRAWESEEKKGLAIEVDADSLGHDLLWGTSTYARTLRKTAIEGHSDTTPDAGNDDDSADTGSGDRSGNESDQASAAPADTQRDPVPTPF